jgi:iron complex outermembrane recepter protein
LAGPVNGIVATESATATKSATPIAHTPPAVNVVGAEEMEIRAVRTTTEALLYTPGVNAESFGPDPRTDWTL